MTRISKLIVGIRPAQKMFRVGSLSGIVIDAILAARSDKLLGDDYFTEVGKATELSGFQLSNEERGNFLKVDEANVVFIKDVYSSEHSIDIDSLLSEWRFLWKQINSSLAIRDVRRIGVAAEHQIMSRQASASLGLLNGLTSLKGSQHPAKFLIQYEDRRAVTNKVGVPDTTTDAFINVIRHFYDGELDADHKNAGYINANLDVQKYFSPLLNGNVFDEVGDVYRLFQKEKSVFDADLKERGLI